MRIAAAVLCSVLTAGGALAQAAPAQPPSAPPTSGTAWAQLPTGQDLARAYPRAARLADVGGKVVLRCVVGGDGALGPCKVAEETPADQGFGAAALDLATRFRMKPFGEGGVARPGQSVRIPIRFDPPAAPALPPASVGAPGDSAPVAAAPAPLPTDLKHPAGAIYATFQTWQVLRFYPEAAARNHVSGLVRLRCRIGAAGQLTRCAILSEDPPGYHFAEAAALLSGYFHARPTAADGETTAGKTVVIPIRFDPPPPTGR